jgi:hypothetical protein
MFGHSNEKIHELMKILDYSWENKKLSKNEYNQLIAKLKKGDIVFIEDYLIKKGIDKKIIDDLPTTDGVKSRRKRYIHSYSPHNEENDYKYFEDKIEEREGLLHEFQRKNNALSAKLKQTENHNNNMRGELNVLIKQIQKLESAKSSLSETVQNLMSENSELKNQSQQNRIDEKIPEYVEDVSLKLDAADLFFTKMSKYWSITGVVLAMFAVTAAFYTFFDGLEAISDITKLTPTAIIYTFVRGGLGIALLSWISYVSFSNARNYTHESILRKDRQHALTFGRLFLQIYGSTATKEDAINVFKDWNMSGDTAFSSKSKTPPNPLSYIESLKNTFSRSNNANKDSSKEND